MHLRPLLGLPINSKSENFVNQTVSSAETACSLAKAWQWWHSPQRSPGQGTDLLIMCPQKPLNSSFAGRCSMKNLWPLHEIFRCISCFLKWNHSSYQKLSVETGMRQLENRMISLSYHISCQHLWGTGHALAHTTNYVKVNGDGHIGNFTSSKGQERAL